MTNLPVSIVFTSINIAMQFFAKYRFRCNCCRGYTFINYQISQYKKAAYIMEKIKNCFVSVVIYWLALKLIAACKKNII